MMKKSTTALLLLMIALVCAGSVKGQNFSVSIDAKNIFADPYFYPKQRGESFQFKVNVKNKTESTQTISINKEATFPYPVHNWVSIANNSIKVAKGGTATFLLTVTIPSSSHDATDGLYYNMLDLTAKTDGGNNSEFSGPDFNFIIDNEPPRDVAITQKSATDNQVVVSFSAYDDWSHWYSNQTENAHSNGIKKYTITLKSKDGSTTVTSGTCEGSAASTELTLSHSAIRPNTEYNASVKATDLAGNSQNASVGVKTAPSIPQNFSTSDLYYTGVTLHWNACAGATNYRVYLYESGSSNYINSYPTNTNSINITGLQDDKTYQVAVKSGSAVGESRLSSKYSFTTPGITIVGSSIVCEQGDFGVEGLLPGSIVNWSVSNTTIASVDDSGTLRFIPWHYGVINLNADVTYKNSTIRASKIVSIGHPEFEIECINDFGNGSAVFFASPKEGGGDLYTQPLNYHWSYIDANGYNNVNVGSYLNTTFVDVQPMITFPEAGNYIVTMKATGMDGCEVPLATLNYYSMGNNGPWNLSVFPNPANDLVTVQVDLKQEIEKMSMMTFEKEEPFNCEIQLWNNAGIVKSFNSLEKIKQFSVNDLSKGLYYIKVIIGENTYTQTLFIN